MLSTTRKYVKKLLGRMFSITSSIRSLRAGSLIFQCNVCGNNSVTAMENLGRETISCLSCGSTVRMRFIIHALSKILFGRSLALQDFPVQPDIRVIGLSDWDGYAGPLARKLAYTNTYYHQEPRLDITAIDPALEGTFDVLISSDVFEHVAPPVSTAFQNSFRLLKPGGKLVLTVPYNFEPETKEHFPELFHYEIQRQGNKSVLYNTTRDGRKQTFEDLNFHGGAGETLEMRRFSLDGLKRELGSAGFQKIELLDEPNFKYGVYLKYHWSLPIVAMKP